jgi:hypothetical protein
MHLSPEQAERYRQGIFSGREQRARPRPAAIVVGLASIAAAAVLIIFAVQPLRIDLGDLRLELQHVKQANALLKQELLGMEQRFSELSNSAPQAASAAATISWVPSRFRPVVQHSLDTGVLGRPALLDGIVADSGASLPHSQRQRSPLVHPVGTVVLSDTPELQWRPIPGASRYWLVVSDAQQQVVAKNRSVRRLRWKPPHPLARGETYTWQVTALVEGSKVTYPRPTDAEAKFTVADEQVAREVQAIADARPQGVRPQVALAVIYAEQGMLDDAERELADVLGRNPNDFRAEALLRNIRGWRQKE